MGRLRVSRAQMTVSGVVMETFKEVDNASGSQQGLTDGEDAHKSQKSSDQGRFEIPVRTLETICCKIMVALAGRSPSGSCMFTLPQLQLAVSDHMTPSDNSIRLEGVQNVKNADSLQVALAALERQGFVRRIGFGRHAIYRLPKDPLNSNSSDMSQHSSSTGQGHQGVAEGGSKLCYGLGSRNSGTNHSIVIQKTIVECKIPGVILAARPAASLPTPRAGARNSRRKH